MLAYQSCWLKYYYPAEFLCALLNNQPMGFYPPHVLINDAKRHGLRIMKPDVNISRAQCHVENHNGKSVRIGLAFIKGLSETDASAIVQERKERGDFRSLSDFVRRMPLRMDIIENMIAIGAFDAFGLSRREALWQVGLFIPTKQFGKTNAKQAKERTKGVQISLPLPVEQDAVSLPPTSAWERMAADYRVLGMSPHYHPLGLLRSRLPEEYATSRDLERLRDGALIRIAGLVIVRQRPGTAKGVTFLLIEDEFGLANIVVYRNLYEAQRTLVRNEPFVVITGVVSGKIAISTSSPITSSDSIPAISRRSPGKLASPASFRKKARRSSRPSSPRLPTTTAERLTDQKIVDPFVLKTIANRRKIAEDSIRRDHQEIQFHSRQASDPGGSLAA